MAKPALFPGIWGDNFITLKTTSYMKAINYNKKTTAAIVIGYAALVFMLAILFTSFQSVRHQERSGCYPSKRLSGYGIGGYQYRTHVSNRQSF
jgi:hypothetical protein